MSKVFDSFEKSVFVTLFDSSYLSRGLVMYESLLANSPNFTLYIIAFDDVCYEFLTKLNLKNVHIIPLGDFEDDDLISVKESRSKGEYCWTSTPKSILYIFDHFYEEKCTYIDSDLMFFNDPSVLINEIPENKSVMITEHRFSDYCNQTNSAGIYNVQFMTFKNNKDAINVLEWWEKKCIENCCFDEARGLCGDQKYLDDWTERFSCVHVMKNRGGGVGPWNVNRYSFVCNDNTISYLYDGEDNGVLVFYHFHGITFYDKGVVGLTGNRYIVPDSAVAIIYKKYVRMHYTLLNRFHINPMSELVNVQHFRDDNTDYLHKEKNYYLVELFL